MADLREQIIRALVATWEDPEQGPDALDYEAADAVLAVVEPAIRAAQAQALRDAAHSIERHGDATTNASAVRKWLRARADEIAP